MLKQKRDELSKSWTVDTVHESFYRGGTAELSKTDNTLACLYEDNVSFVNWKSGQVVGKLLDENDESRESISCFCLHPFEREIVVATSKYLLQHWRYPQTFTKASNSPQPERVRVMKGHTMPIQHMCYDDSGTLVATACSDKGVRVWDITRGYCTHSFKGHTDICRHVQFYDSGVEEKNNGFKKQKGDKSMSGATRRLLLLSTSDDCTIRVHDLLTSSTLHCYKNHTALATALTVSYDSRILVSCSRDKVVNMYDMQHPHSHLLTLPIMEECEGCVLLSEDHSANVLGMYYGSEVDGKCKQQVLCTCGSAGIIKLFKISYRHEGEAVAPTCVSFGQVQINKSSAAATASPLYAATQMIYHADRAELVVLTGDQNIYSYSLQRNDGTKLMCTRQLSGCNEDILDLCILPAASPAAFCRVAVVTNSSQVRLLSYGCDESDTDAPFFTSAAALDGHTDIVLAVDTSPDGRYVATASKDHTCRLWDLDQSSDGGVCVAVAEGHTDAVGCVCVSQRLASYASQTAFMCSGGGDKILKRWALTTPTDSNVQKLSNTHSIRAHDKDINTIACAPNDSMLVTGSQDKLIKIWKSSNLTQLATLTGHKRGVWRVSFSPVDKCLVSCSGDRTLRLWSLTDFSCIRSFEGHGTSVLSVKFCCKGMQLMSGSSDGVVKLWNVRTGECVNTFDEHFDRVWTLAMGKIRVPVSPPDDMELASDEPVQHVEERNIFISGGSDSRLLVWRDSTAVEEQKRLETAEQALLMEQQLHNDVRNKNFDKALEAALALSHSNKLLGILICILEEAQQKEVGVLNEKSAGDVCIVVSNCLDRYVSNWQDEELSKVIGYMVDWNTNAKHCYVCQMLLESTLRVVDLNRLSKIQMWKQSLPALTSYSDKHFQRLDKLHQATYVMEYLSSLMSITDKLSAGGDGEASNSKSIASAGKSQHPHPAAAGRSSADEEDDLVIFPTLKPASSTGVRGAKGNVEKGVDENNSVRVKRPNSQQADIQEGKGKRKKSKKSKSSKD